jgi:uncharacterized Zn-binding protein involved in type VI secretion
MPAVARVGDAIAHNGVVSGHLSEGSPDTFVDGIAVVRVGDHVDCDQHGTQEVQVQTGSPTVFVGGAAVARVGDLTTCNAEIIEGSPDQFDD